MYIQDRGMVPADYEMRAVGLEALSYEDWRTPAKCRDVHFAGGPLTKSLKRWTVLPTTQARLEG